jgi:hypothetical protein
MRSRNTVLVCRITACISTVAVGYDNRGMISGFPRQRRRDKIVQDVPSGNELELDQTCPNNHQTNHSTERPEVGPQREIVRASCSRTMAGLLLDVRRMRPAGAFSLWRGSQRLNRFWSDKIPAPSGLDRPVRTNSTEMMRCRHPQHTSCASSGCSADCFSHRASSKHDFDRRTCQRECVYPCFGDVRAYRRAGCHYPHHLRATWRILGCC